MGPDIITNQSNEIKKSKKPIKFYKNIYLQYTFSFLLLLPVIFAPFILRGKSFVWLIDGISQHYPALSYYGKVLRSLLSGNGFKMIDFNIGMGLDTISTLHYYVIGDPIALFSVFITPKNAVVMYNTLILFRFYLAGISFILLMKFWKKNGPGVLLGSLIYVFCGYALFAGIRHPFFLNPMICLPLILIGLEQVLRRKKPYFLIVMVFISLASNFYFFFIISVIAVIYVIFRYFYTYRKDYKNIVTGLLLTGLRTGGYYLLGITMASVIFLPVAYVFFHNSRLGVKPDLMTGLFHYGKQYYVSLMQGIIAPGVKTGHWVELSFSSVAAVSAVIMFCNKKYRQLSIVFVLTFGALLIPAFGYFMNCFTYICNRWCFMVSLIVAVTFTFTYEKVFCLGKAEKILLLVGIAGYGILAFVLPSVKTVKYEFIILLISVSIILLLQKEWFQNRKILQSLVLYALVLITLAFNGYAQYSIKGYVNEFYTPKQVVRKTTKGVLSLIPSIKDDSFYRIETYGDSAQNEALCVGFNDVASYFSLADGNDTAYFLKLELANQRSAYRFDDLDNRTILDALANVKYFVSSDKNAVPYAYRLLKVKKAGARNYYLFENTFALPFGYTYDSYITEDEFHKLSALEQQNAMLDSAVINGECDYKKNETMNFMAGLEKLDAKIIPDENIELSENKIKVIEPGAAITLEFQSKKKSEVYARLDNLKILSRSLSMTFFGVEGENDAVKNVNIKSRYCNSYFGKANYLINSGYSRTGKQWIKIIFKNKGTFTCDGIEVYNQKMSHYKKQCKVLSQSCLQNIVMGNNSIRGDISLDQRKIMMFSIPYSEGWSAYVDGRKTELLRGNVMYTALPLEAGAHHIILKYETPLLKEGAMVSGTSLFIFAGIIVFNRIKKKKTERKNKINAEEPAEEMNQAV